MSNNPNNLITASDSFDVLDTPFKSDRERIKYMNKAYKGMSIAKAFSIFYNIPLDNEVKSNRSINTVNNLEVGKCYTGTVISIDKSSIEFDVPGVKESIICRESFGTCLDNVRDYLLTHDNKLLFEVRGHTNGEFTVSVLNAYYKAWTNMINKAIDREDSISVHIDSLVKGGYVCHTDITPLCQLTGKSYTSSVFIPGSHIVLNIEHDFEKWIGQDVTIVPQKFVEFRRDVRTGLIENSLVGSRKRVLQIMGVQNMYTLYNEDQDRKKLAEMAGGELSPEVFRGTVTGIINSNKKTGIFVELDGKYITGLMPIPATELLDYKPGDNINVVVKEFEIQEGKEPFVINKRKQIVKCNVRPVFAIA
jgi:ribosomal protein S1